MIAKAKWKNSSDAVALVAKAKKREERKRNETKIPVQFPPDLLSAEQIVGLNGQAFAEGLMVMAWETLAAIAMVFTAIYLLPKYMNDQLYK